MAIGTKSVEAFELRSSISIYSIRLGSQTGSIQWLFFDNHFCLRTGLSVWSWSGDWNIQCRRWKLLQPFERSRRGSFPHRVEFQGILSRVQTRRRLLHHLVHECATGPIHDHCGFDVSGELSCLSCVQSGCSRQSTVRGSRPAQIVRVSSRCLPCRRIESEQSTGYGWRCVDSDLRWQWVGNPPGKHLGEDECGI